MNPQNINLLLKDDSIYRYIMFRMQVEQPVCSRMNSALLRDILLTVDANKDPLKKAALDSSLIVIEEAIRKEIYDRTTTILHAAGKGELNLDDIDISGLL